jgi:hypothetical protein
MASGTDGVWCFLAVFPQPFGPFPWWEEIMSVASKRDSARCALLAVAVLLFFLLAQSFSYAQEVGATIYGAVSDPAGAAVPDATVVVLNPETGQTVSVTSGADGNYLVPSLRPGTYSLSVERTGFAKSVQTGIKLDVNQNARIDVTLKVGATTSVVEVAGSAPLVETATATVSTEIDNRQVTELPLNVRRFGQLPLLMPGTVTDRGGFSSNIFGSPFSENTYAANGARGSGNNVLIDGIDSKNMMTGGFSVQPSPDAVQEFKVQTESFSAVFGKNAGSTINLVTKSGTNQFHGTGFEFLRNNVLDARNFFDQTRPPFKRNQFGGYLGGPIKKDKTFFFGGYEALRQRKGETDVDTIPTPAMLGGDFSQFLTGSVTLSPCAHPGPGDPVYDTGQIFDPGTVRNITCHDGTTAATATPFQGNVVPTPMISTTAQKVIPYWPSPNAPGLTSNFIVNPNTGRTDNQVTAKIDHEFSDKDKVFGRYLYGGSVTYTPDEAYSTLPGFGDKIYFRGQNVALSWTHILSPTMLNEFRFGFSRNTDIGTCAACPRANGFMEGFGIPDLTAITPQDEGFPAFEFAQGYTTIGDSNYRPVESNDMVEKYNDTMTINKNKHTLAFGADIQPYQSLRDQAPFSPHGQLFYQGNYSNNSVADFLLGYPSSVGRSVTKGVNNHDGMFWNFFVQEDYRASRKLTVNIGLRWEYHEMPTDRRNIGAVLFPIPGAGLFTPGNALLFLPGYSTADANCNTPRAFNAEGERIIGCSSDMKKYGFTGRVANSLAFPDHFNWAPRVGLAYRPTDSDRFVIRAGYGLFFDLSEFNVFHYGFNNPIQGISQFNNASQANIPGGVFVAPTFSNTTAFTSAAIPSLADSFVSVNVDPHFRQPYINEWDFDVQSQLSSTIALDVRYLGTSAAQMSHFHFFGNQAVPGPGAIQPRRLYPDFGFTATSSSGANANYNSLQVQFTKRYSSGLSILAGYTYAKQITDNEGEEGAYSDGGAPQGQDDNHPGQERGLGVDDVRHRITFSSIYLLPFGEGKRFANSNSRLLNAVVGGWTLTNIISWQTGFPISIQAGYDVANTGTGNWRPDRICNGALPVSQRTVADWFDTSCFTGALLAADQLKGIYRFGNSGRGILEGPRMANIDLGLLKDFQATERLRMQFRAEFFNAFNQAHFNPDGVITNMSAGNFGQVISAGEPRDIQFALKLSF